MTTTTNTRATTGHAAPEPPFTWAAIWTQAESLATDLSAAGANWQPLSGRLDALAGDWGALLLGNPEAERHQAELVAMLGDAGGKGIPGKAPVKKYLKIGAEVVRRCHAEAQQAERQAERAAAAEAGEAPLPEYQVLPGFDEPIELVAAHALLAERPERLAFHASGFWTYNEAGGYWSTAQDVAIGAIALEVLRRCYSEDMEKHRSFRFGTAADQRNTAATVKVLAGTGPLARTSPPEVIAFADGTYNLKLRLLVPHSPHHGATFAVDAPWRGLQQDPPPAVLAFVDRCYCLDALPIVRALVRWAIDPTIRYGQAFHLLGQSHSGKGLLLAVVQSLFPAVLTSSLSHPAMLETPERIAQHVLGRRLVLFPDCPPRAPRHSSGHLSGWYSLVVNEPVTARRLHATDTWTGLANVRSIIASTTQLQLSDGRDGYLSRVLTLPTVPRTGEVNPALKDGLLGDTEAHREMRAHLAGWALGMPLAEVEAVLRRDDPAGILRETGADLAREADPPSRWADLALVPHPFGPQAPVEAQDWREMFDCYMLWCKRENIRHEGNRERFQGQIRSVLGMSRCLPRGKGPRPERLDLPRLDAGFALRQGLVGGTGGWPQLVEARLQPGGLEALAALPVAQRPDP